MNYVGTVIRPPSEAGSIILQVSLGCSHNACTFCGAYKGKMFSQKSLTDIALDIQYAARHYRDRKTVFLADGDAIALSQESLEEILINIRRDLPWVRRVNSYGSPGALLDKSAAQLIRLKSLGLSRIYMGLESGSNIVLALMKKGADAEQIILAGKKTIHCGLYLSTSVILGLGGKRHSEDHIYHTALALNKIKPQHIAALTLLVVPSTPLAERIKKKEFSMLSPSEILQELRMLIQQLTVDRAQFHANHASNHLPLSGILARDKDKFITMIDNGINGQTPLMPDYMRAL